MEEKKVEVQSVSESQVPNNFKNVSNLAIVSPDHLYIRDNEGTIVGLLKKGDVVEKLGTPNEKGFIKINCNIPESQLFFVQSKNDKYVLSKFLKDKVVNK